MKNFKPNSDFKYYMYFIEERMNIFWNRLEGKEPPYSEDKVFQENKFTNVYRSLDRASQYILREVIYNGNQYTKEEMFWRILIYKHFNLPSTWDLLIERFGDINSTVTLDQISDYLDTKMDEGLILYSNAYMMTTAFLVGDRGQYCFLKKNKWRKYRYYFYIFQKELIEEGKLKPILEAKSFTEIFEAMKSVTSFGDFTTYQYCQDLNYTEFFNFNDNEFCAAGPGTQRGIERCFDIQGKADYGEIVKWVHANFEQLCEDYDCKFRPLSNHLPTVPDLSNCFCETDKMLRGLGVETEGKKVSGKRIKNKFVQNSKPIEFVFPPKWNVGNLK
jgi:hypothetical protein